MSQNSLRILDQSEIHARLKRMAYEIYENNYHQTELIVIGIDERGGFIAEKLAALLEELSPLKIHLVDAEVDRSEAMAGVSFSAEWDELAGKPILVVDDVLYSGFTMLSVVSILLQLEPTTIQTAVLIDRGHRKFPVSADYLGLVLATTLHQHVSVRIAEDEANVEVFLV
jgi:pyrimidine operon attenuation protein/uracil phosphoribosyltransferase